MGDLPDMISDEQDDFAEPEAPIGPNELAMESLLIVHYGWKDADIEKQVNAVMDRIAPVEVCGGGRRFVRWMMAAAVGLVVLGAGLVYQMHSRTAQRVVETQPANTEAGKPSVTAMHVDAAETRRVALGDVGTMLIQGPADLELIGTSRARLHRGQVRVRVTSERGRGFVVETPRAEVTDLGTEFGVDVAGDTATGVVVFDGSVDLAVSPEKGHAASPTERLVQGEGLVVQRSGELDRLMSIVVDADTRAFRQPGEPGAGGSQMLIADVWDNISVAESKKHYEIVPGGLREDALCYVDRAGHEWNGANESGMPRFLIGADYVKTFNNDKIRKNMKVCVKLSRAARLFVFFDNRVPVPAWLLENFHRTAFSVGVDEGPLKRRGGDCVVMTRGVGAGKSIDNVFSVWERMVEQPGVIELGPNAGQSGWTSMYGIAAVGLDKAKP